jgi:hypothetical protein
MKKQKRLARMEETQGLVMWTDLFLLSDKKIYAVAREGAPGDWGRFILILYVYRYSLPRSSYVMSCSSTRY